MGRMVRRVRVVLLLVLLLTSRTLASTKYSAIGAGSCGDQLLAWWTLSPSLCAIRCNQTTLPPADVMCAGFSFQQSFDGGAAARGTCMLHQTLNSPDGRSDTTCFLPEPVAETIPTPLAPTTLHTTTSTTATSSSTTPTTSTVATNITTTALTINTTTMAITTTIYDAQGIVPADFSKASRHDVFGDQSPVCYSDAAPIGIFFSTSHYLFCLYSSIYKVLFSEPDVTCTNRLECLDVTCDPGRALVGFKVDSVGVWHGPCADFISEVSVLDQNDCQTISGPLQDDDRVEYDWQAWRICGGSAENLYIMTAIYTTIGWDGSINYDTVTCCRVRLP